MYLFFRLTESDLLWYNTDPLHWKASRVYQILLHHFYPSRCSGSPGTAACLHTCGNGRTKSAWWRQSELKWGEPGLWDWCVWTLLPIFFAEYWIAMPILPQQGFLDTPSLPAVSWAITMCRIQCWDLWQGATPAEMAKSNSSLLWRIH